MSRSPRIEVAIGRLVLRGVAPGDAAALRGALAAELAARLAGADPAAPGGGGAFRLEIGAAGGPAGVGAEAGRAIASALGAPAAGRRR